MRISGDVADDAGIPHLLLLGRDVVRRRSAPKRLFLSIHLVTLPWHFVECVSLHAVTLFSDCSMGGVDPELQYPAT
jgi:hypothetical protein